MIVVKCGQTWCVADKAQAVVSDLSGIENDPELDKNAKEAMPEECKWYYIGSFPVVDRSTNRLMFFKTLKAMRQGETMLVAENDNPPV